MRKALWPWESYWFLYCLFWGLSVWIHIYINHFLAFSFVLSTTFSQTYCTQWPPQTHINFFLWSMNIFICCWQVILGHFYIISIIDEHGDLPCNNWALTELFSPLCSIFYCPPLSLHLHSMKKEKCVWEEILPAMTFKHLTFESCLFLLSFIPNLNNK